jgi:hypothetical protein
MDPPTTYGDAGSECLTYSNYGAFETIVEPGS